MHTRYNYTEMSVFHTIWLNRGVPVSFDIILSTSTVNWIMMKGKTMLFVLFTCVPGKIYFLKGEFLYKDKQSNWLHVFSTLSNMTRIIFSFKTLQRGLSCNIFRCKQRNMNKDFYDLGFLEVEVIRNWLF